MPASAATSLKRMRQCQSDLAANGINLARAGERTLRMLVRRHLDYFQLMLGYDAGPRVVIALAQRLKHPRHRSGSNRYEKKWVGLALNQSGSGRDPPPIHRGQRRELAPSRK